MDIAEIRKKAKAQARAGDAVAAASPAPVAAPLQTPPAPVENALAERQPAVSAARDESAPLVAMTDGLDRLFAVTDEFALATDDAYADILDNQADSQSLARRQYLAFHLGVEEYALDITQISEIIKVREFTDIPRAPAYILGIISLRGVVVPVFDLRQRLNLGAAEMLPASRIVVCQQDDITIGLLVDSINQVVKLADDELEPPPGILTGLDREMVSAIGRDQGRMIILLNLKSVLEVELH